MSELKPCPFCGGEAHSMAGSMVSHRCSKGRGEAFPETWNSRPIEDALRARVEELERGDTELSIKADAMQSEALKYQSDAVSAESRAATAEETIRELVEAGTHLLSGLDEYWRTLEEGEFAIEKWRSLVSKIESGGGAG